MLAAIRTLAVTACLCASSAHAQTTRYLIDFGDEALQTVGQAEVWNNIHNDNAGLSVPLVDSTGAAGPVALNWIDPMGRAEMNGVVTPAPGSALEALGWPASALSDNMYADSLSSVPEGEFEFTGLDPAATYELSLVGSVLGAADLYSSEYTAFGIVPASAVAQVTDNDAEVERLRGLHADATGSLRVRIRNATTNDNLDRRFYINAVELVEFAPGTQTPLLAFDIDRLDTSRLIAKGPFVVDVEVYTNNLNQPGVALRAVDLNTGIEPTWLSLLPMGIAGETIQLLVNPTGLAPREYVARVQASAEGYASSTLELRLNARAPGRINILYYGNSYSATNGSVNRLVDALAEEAGFDVPLGVPRYGQGKNLAYHLNASQTLAISRSFPIGEEWDWVVMQGGTLEAAATAGNTPVFVANGVQIMDNVRAHSPGALAVIYQTWARGEGHSLYTGTSPTYPGGPLEMHLELEAGNEQLAAAIEASYGLGSAMIAAAGETSALRGFDPAYYKPDLSHPAPTLTMQAGTTIFSRIYGVPACGLDPDFATPGPLALHLSSEGLVEDDWRDLAGIADLTGDPALRPFPGSGEDLLLEVGEPGKTLACGVGSFPAGQRLRFELTSPAGSYEGLPATLYFDVVGASGGTTFVPPWPEVHYSSSAWVQGLSGSLGPSGLTVELALGLDLVGKRVLVQGVSEGPSTATGNTMTLTDAHVIRVTAPLQKTPLLLK